MTPRARTTLRYAAIAAGMAAVFALTHFIAGPAPPKKIRFATGAPHGAYYTFGARLASLIEEEEGPHVEPRATAGSVENLRLLATRKVDVAFVQGGVATAMGRVTGPDRIDTSRLRSIARVYSEPLWVFYRGGREVGLLHDLPRITPGRPVRIDVGEAGSGTHTIAIELLRANNLREGADYVLKQRAAEAAIAGFRSGDTDALFLVAAPTAEWIQTLLHTDGARLMNFVNHAAYARRLPYLAAIDLEQGLLSIADDLPPARVVLLAPAATLVTRDDVHPRVVELVTKVAARQFGDGNLVDLPGEFPSPRGLELPQHEAARRFLVEGESWASRHLSLGALRLLSALQLILIPLIAVLLPALRLMPVLWRIRVNRLIGRHYESLRDVDTKMTSATTPEELRRQLAQLQHLHDELARVTSRVPGTSQNELYHWRTHIRLVRAEGLERLEEMERRPAGAQSARG